MKLKALLPATVALVTMMAPIPCAADYYLAGSGFSSSAGNISSSGYSLTNTVGMPLGGTISQADFLLVSGFARWQTGGAVVAVPELREGSASHGFWLDQNWPNPFNPVTRIRFSIPGRNGELRHARVTVFDVSGRIVAVLADGMMRSGPNELLWRGSGTGGRSVSSGLYLVQIRCGSLSAARRAVLLR